MGLGLGMVATSKSSWVWDLGTVRLGSTQYPKNSKGQKLCEDYVRLGSTQYLKNEKRPKFWWKSC